MDTAIRVRHGVGNIVAFAELIAMILIGYLQYISGEKMISFVYVSVSVLSGTFIWMLADYNVYRVGKGERLQRCEIDWNMKYVGDIINALGIKVDKLIKLSNTIIIYEVTIDGKQRNCVILKKNLGKITKMGQVVCKLDNGYTVIICDKMSSRRIRKLVRRVGNNEVK